MCVVASFITPLESHRHLIREIVGDDRISMIFADSPLEVCRQRDVKGLQSKAQAGQTPQMTSIGSSFEGPTHVDLRLPTATLPPEASSRILLDFAMTRFGHAE
jgi:adenylylsulfate kinase-like enzyme